MKFRDDIDPATTWVTSDSHFGHDNIVGFCHRPEDHEQVMIAEWRKEVPDDPGTTLLHLGDLAYRSNARFKAITARELTPSTHPLYKITPNARKLLIEGNHDDQRSSFYRNSGFRKVRPFAIPYGVAGQSRVPCEDCDGKVNPRFDDSPPICKTCLGWGTVGSDYPFIVSFSHYAWSDEEEGRPMGSRDVRLHGHVHNTGYSRGAYVPFLLNHINLSAEQTKYKPVNLKVLLDAALLGQYERTTQDQLDEARVRRAENKARKAQER